MLISPKYFEDLQNTTVKFLIEEIAYVHRTSTYSLKQQVRKYGYMLSSYHVHEERPRGGNWYAKEYIYPVRDFQWIDVQPLPDIPELKIRRQAEHYELQRQKMGYVTQQELELAKETITMGKLQVDEKDASRLQEFRTIYGLYWLGYEKDDRSLSSYVWKIHPCKDKEERMSSIKRLRPFIVCLEEIQRLRDRILKKSSEPARFVKDYLQVQEMRMKLKQGTKTKSSFLVKIVQYFKSPEIPSQDQEEERILSLDHRKQQ